MRNFLTILLLVLIIASCQAPQQTETKVATDGSIDRTVLPIREPDPPVITELDARNVKAPARFEVKA
ncbi:MAG: hypothetical protein JNN04_00730, partial [Cyclobacteriaceae bacterium]|nr:hypothetical protein [Cyclobacteriaceae bacterium]